MKTNEDWHEFREACRHMRIVRGQNTPSGDTCRWWNKDDDNPPQSSCTEGYCPRLKEKA